jgi:photosystem II stability/assembly factor-like uncharacterized protein
MNSEKLMCYERDKSRPIQYEHYSGERGFARLSKCFSISLLFMIFTFFSYHSLFGQSWGILSNTTTTGVNYTVKINGTNVIIMDGSGKFKFSTNSGNTWTVKQTPIFNPTNFFYCNSAVWWCIEYNGATIAYQTSDAGLSWTQGKTLPSPVNQNYRPKRMWFNGNVGYIAGENHIFKTNNGSDFTDKAYDNTYHFESLDFTDDYKGWVAGYKDSQGIILYTSDGGTNWTELSVLNAINYKCLTVSNNIILAGGLPFSGTVNLIKSFDGGNTWSNLTFPKNTSQLNQIRIISTGHYWVLGEDNGIPFIYKTADDGATWTETPITNYTNSIQDFDVSRDETFGLASGNDVFLKNPPPPQKKITIISPAVGDICDLGTTKDITWDFEGFTGMIKIELSRNNGTTYSSLANSVDVNTSTYSWSVDEPESDSCKIKITSLDDPLTYGISGLFKVRKNLSDTTLIVTSSKVFTFYNVYPNPSTELISIQFQGNENVEDDVYIYSEIGTFARCSKVKWNPSADGNVKLNQSNPIQISNLPKGIYFVIIKSNNKFYYQQFIKG